MKFVKGEVHLMADTLPMSSYVILGLLETCGPCTPYELKKTVDESIGYFWDFPRAQLYLDPARLVELGLLTEEREETGRRRRVFHPTEAGRAVLRDWLRQPATREVELRDTGLLKLYFGFLLETDGVVALAQREAAMHQQRHSEYSQIARHLEAQPDGAFALATVRLGLMYEQMAIQFWEDVVEHPPTMPATAPAPKCP